MTQARLVTVIVPVFNGARFIRAAIASIAKQAHGRVRALVIDDGSTDDSVEVIAALAADHDWIETMRHPVNRGVAATRNAGITRVETPYIAFLDQDDTWADEKLDRQFGVLDAEPDLDFVLARQSFHLEAGVARPPWAKDRMFEGPQPGNVFGAMLGHRNCFDRVGLLREDILFGNDDVDWFARVRTSDLRYRMLDDVLLNRTLHDTNHSRLTHVGNPELLRVMRDAIRRRRGKEPGA